MLRFDEPTLSARLEALSLRARVAFAAACAERLRGYFGYPDSPPTPSVLEGALKALGKAIRQGLPDTALQAAAEACEASLDVDDDAVAAVMYACGAQGCEGAQAAAWAARRGYEARDRLVSEALGIDFNLEGAEQRVLEHPVLQAELHQQANDLKVLASSDDQAPAVLARARKAGGARDAV